MCRNKENLDALSLIPHNIILHVQRKLPFISRSTMLSLSLHTNLLSTPPPPYPSFNLYIHSAQTTTRVTPHHNPKKPPHRKKNMGSAHSKPKKAPPKKSQISYPRPNPNSKPLHAYGYNAPPPPRQYYHSKPLPRHPDEIAYYKRKPLPAVPPIRRKPVPPPPRSQVEYYSRRGLPPVPSRRR